MTQRFQGKESTVHARSRPALLAILRVRSPSTSASPSTSRSSTAFGSRRCSSRPTIRAELARAHRRRQRRQGHEIEARPRTRRRRRHDGDQGEGPADPQRRHAEDPAAHLPRRQLLRRPPARHALAPTSRRRHDPDHPDRDPVQLDQVLTALQTTRAQDLQQSAQGPWRRRSPTSRPRPKTPSRTRVRGLDRGPGAQRVLRRAPARAQGHGDRERGTSSAPSA